MPCNVFFISEEDQKCYCHGSSSDLETQLLERYVKDLLPDLSSHPAALRQSLRSPTAVSETRLDLQTERNYHHASQKQVRKAQISFFSHTSFSLIFLFLTPCPLSFQISHGLPSDTRRLMKSWRKHPPAVVTTAKRRRISIATGKSWSNPQITTHQQALTDAHAMLRRRAANLAVMYDLGRSLMGRNQRDINWDLLQKEVQFVFPAYSIQVLTINNLWLITGYHF